ncbi:MAG: S-methyl-5'-thioadenosine phosphorylase [Anaerolineales bacterium]|nr:S-methyl-5'-thioadenosine phosphorylase [Anaerolineales bacterium]
MSEIQLGILSGSGLPELKGILQGKCIEMDTPFGKPSGPIMTGSFRDTSIAFLNRHGKGHTLTPNEINYRANIYALKSLGVKRIIAVTACGSLRDDYKLGDLVVPDQLFDYTNSREKTFFGNGIVTHVNVADPFCKDLSETLVQSAEEAGFPPHRTGTYITIEGSRFSTRAESNTYRAWGMSVIGMTVAPEAFLAREAEMCYSVLAYVTNYDVWHLNEEPVSASKVLSSVHATSSAIVSVINRVCANLPEGTSCHCGCALDDAFMTDLASISVETRERFAPLLDRVLQKN